jgi:hypothetical protein
LLDDFHYTATGFGNSTAGACVSFCVSLHEGSNGLMQSVQVRVRVSLGHPEFGNIVIQQNSDVFKRNAIPAQSRRECMPVMPISA